MLEQKEAGISCPYCGECFTVLLDPSEFGEQYVEDCRVCCRPIVSYMLVTDDGDCKVEVRREDD